ncbi:MAG: hypothetical protein J0H87_06305 [Holosporales bacterium]|nr:hypothetical protein [Holosporales bacterium]
MRHYFVTLVIFLALPACKTAERYSQYDKITKLHPHEYESKLIQKLPQQKSKPISILPKNTSGNVPPSLKQKVTLSTTETVQLKDIFMQIAQQAKVDIALDPLIKGGINFQVYNKEVIEVVHEICAIARLRYKICNNILRIELDRPYLKNYNVQFLSLSRENQNRLSIATDVFTAVDSRKAELDNGSNTLLKAETKTDFWEEVENTLATILLPENMLVEQTEPSYAIHKQAGIVSIFATEAQHQQVEKYLHLLGENTVSQVLIEAKVVEVLLKDEFKSGINWNIIKEKFVLQAPLGRLGTPGPFKETSVQKDVLTMGAGGPEFTSFLYFMEKFGTVRTLSSPRLTVMNNQSAVLKVATNHVFFRIDYNRDYGYDSRREHEYVSSEIQTIPIGLVMVVHPAINLENESITMTLRPTISRIVDEKQDPAVAIVSEQKQQSLVPEVQVRELDSVVHMKSGEIVIMGGLMEERSDNEQTSIPGITETVEGLNIPFLDFLFKSKSDQRVVSELVIFLRATIFHNGRGPETLTSTITPADQAVYETFTKDPRAFSFKKF